jgi:hypothetical protein
MKRSPVKVSHVASKSASAWDLTLKYGEAPLPSESHGGGIVRGDSLRGLSGLDWNSALCFNCCLGKRLAYWLRETT